MPRIHVEVTDEYLRNLIKYPRQGLEELIDNALDADAKNIVVEFGRTVTGAVGTVTVRDDGEGMSRARATSAFANLGNSWKLNEPHTASGRRRRGSKGHGRWAAFALGNSVTWTSTSANLVGDGFEQVMVSGTRTKLDGFEVDGQVGVGGPAGTVVVVRDVYENAQVVDSPDERVRLTRLYALALRRQPSLSITLDGQPLNPDEVSVDTASLPVEVDRDDVPAGAVRLTVVAWDKKVRGVRPVLVFTDENGEALHDHSDWLPRAPWPYTAFLSWDEFEAYVLSLPSPTFWDDRLNAVVGAAVDALHTHFDAKKAQAHSALLERWKGEGTYPYQGPARGAVEEAERDLFDLVAVTAAPAIEASDTKGRKFALRMLREAVTNDASDLTHVLRQVLDLDESELADLSELLQRTTLSSLLGAGREVVRRLDVLADLHTILHDPGFAPKLGEKKHLHEIVAAEPWVFGDEYTTAVSERELTAVLAAHQKILGVERLLVDPTAPGPKPTVDGKDGRIDLMLSRVSPVSEQVRQHLVVELKRPSVPLGLDEITQLEKYAYEIRNDERFHGQDVRWDFWLIGARMTDHAREKAAQFERAALDNFRVRILTWDDLLHARRHQMQFVRDALDLNTTETGGLAEIRRLHGANLPDEIRNEPEPVEAEQLAR